MKLISRSKFISNIKFPGFLRRQVYMATTQGSKVKLPESIDCYSEQVQELCNILHYKDIIHVTIDEKELNVGQTQRKPELHVDGRFMNGGWGHGWNHYCNEVPYERMAIAVASSVARCKVYDGIFTGEPGPQGDLSHIREQVGEGKLLPANEWHLLTPDCVHESLPDNQKIKRSFIRVAFEINPVGLVDMYEIPDKQTIPDS